MQQISFVKRKGPEINSGTFSIYKVLDQILVHHIDSKWRQIAQSLLILHGKLIELGFINYGGEIHVFEPMEKQKYI